LLPRLLAALRPNATVVVAGAMVVDAMVVASAVVDVTAVAAVVVVNTAAVEAVVVNTLAMAPVNPARTASDNRLLMAIAVAKVVLAEPAMATTLHTEARAKPAHGPTINVTTLLVVATVVQASNLAASVAVAAVADSVVAPPAVAPPAVDDESPTHAIGALSPVACEIAVDRR
jgi:hypothetical protein